MKTTQRLKQREPVAREKTHGELERERIFAEYDAAHPKPQPEIEDSDDPRFFMDGDELKEFDRKKLAEDEGKTAQDHREEVLGRIYAKHSAPEEEVSPSDAPPDPDEAIADFRARHPEITDADWKVLDDRAFHAKAPDVWEMQQNLKHSATRKDMDLLLERALDGLEAYKLERDRRAAFRKVAEQRFKTRGL